MINKKMQVNSLRLNTLFGGRGSVSPAYLYSMSKWFYNGSSRFERKPNTIKIFRTLDEAVIYCTENTVEMERARGQIVTFAIGNSENWVLYTYFGPDVSDKNYSNIRYWKRYDSCIDCGHKNIQESLQSNDIVNESLIALKVVQESLFE